MENVIKNILRPFVPQKVWNELKKNSEQKKIIKDWQKNGCQVPAPHIVKQQTIKEYQQKYKYKTLIETGTYLGDMVDAQKSRFSKVISIELSEDLFLQAKNRFKDDNNVTIVQGDSGKVLSNVLLDVNEPAIFWLDGHYSAGFTAKGDKECPIFEELDSIFDTKNFNHVLLIDDARCFTGGGDYPAIEELTAYVKRKNDKYRVEVKHDIIRYVI